MIDLVLNEDIHQRVIVEMLPRAERYLWIVTADIKDLHVKKGRRFVPLLEILSDFVNDGIAVRLFHAKEPGPRFREDFDRYPSLIESDLFERILCPRIHTKAIIVDGKEGFIDPPISPVPAWGPRARFAGISKPALSPTRKNTSLR